jgi:hypothetical protein
VEHTGLRQPLVSHHLGVLRRAGLVRDLPEGRLRRYCLEPDPPVSARSLLDLFRSLATDASMPPWVADMSADRRPVRTEVRPVRSEMEDYLL